MFAPWIVLKNLITCWLIFHDLCMYSSWVVKIVQYAPKKFIKDKPSIDIKNNNRMQLLAWEIPNFLIGKRENMPDTGWLCSCLVLTYSLSITSWLMIVLFHYSGNNAIPGTGTGPNPSLLSRIPLNSHFIESTWEIKLERIDTILYFYFWDRLLG